jgi:hypothetical protein
MALAGKANLGSDLGQRQGVPVAQQDLALLVRCGCFDFCGRARESLLREADASQLGWLPA